MSQERKVTVIPPAIKFMYRVAIYCRVSTRSQEQLDSLANQISYLTRLTASHVNWRLIDIYIDIKSGSNISGRSDFQRMLDDCQNGKIDMIITKSISRFGRNTAATLKSINTLKNNNVDIYFENEELHTKDTQSTFVLSLLQGIAQEESFNRSENIRWGILRKVETGDAQLLRRKCYGYFLDEAGILQIHKDEAKVVKLVYEMYLNGASVLGIIKELENRKIISPAGKNKWCKRTIETILANEKYTGNVVACKTYNEGFPGTRRLKNKGELNKYVVAGCNPEIIPEDQFAKVQEERSQRSNIIKDENGTNRKSTHYSSRHKNYTV